MNDIKECKQFSTRQYVCNNLVAYESTARSISEVQLLFAVTPKMPETCTTTTFTAAINTFQPLDDKRWLFIISKEISLVMQCDHEVSHYKVHGAGIITVPQRCKLHTGYSTISEFQTSNKNISFRIIIPDMRTDDYFEEIKLQKNTNLIPLSMN
jgi:hypothetical protein